VHLVIFNMIKKISGLIIILLFSVQIKAQDVLLTLAGKEVPCVVNKIDTFFVFYQPVGKLEMIEKSLVSKILPKKLILKDGSEKNVVFDRKANDFKGPYIFYREVSKTEKRKDRYNYFSCTINNFDTLLPYQDSIKLSEQETILYAQDSLHKKFEFTVADQMAYTYGRRSARENFISPWSTIGGVVAGFAGGVIFNIFYSAGPAVAYVAINSAIRPKMGPISKRDEPLKDNDFFIEGYRDQARQLKVKNSILGSLPGLAVGVLIKYASGAK
jgi:hypothetical protein